MPQLIELSPETVRVGQGITRHGRVDRHAGTVAYRSSSGETIRFTIDVASAAEPREGDRCDCTYESMAETEWIDDLDGQKRTNSYTARWHVESQCFLVDGDPITADRSHGYMHLP